MDPKRRGTAFQSLLVIICIVAILPGDTSGYMPSPHQAATPNPVSPRKDALEPAHDRAVALQNFAFVSGALAIQPGQPSRQARQWR